MRPVRDLWTELVDRRLWPVALLLVAALVAVPLLLAKKPSAQQAVALGSDAPAVAAIAAQPPGEPVVSVAAGVVQAPLIGRAKDPFHQQFVPARAATAGGSTPSGAPTTGSGSSGPATGGAGGGSGGNAKPAPRSYVFASVDVHFGRAASPLTEIKDVPRLAPLPNAGDPILIFMGTRADHQTAVFMLSTDVRAQGDGRCVPSTKTCEAIELRRGGVALLDVTGSDGFVTQYELDLDSVALHTTSSKATASAAYARASAAGRRLVRRSAATAALASALQWSPSAGVLTAANLDWAQRDGAASHAGTPQAAAGAVTRPPVLTPLP